MTPRGEEYHVAGVCKVPAEQVSTSARTLRSNFVHSVSAKGRKLKAKPKGTNQKP
jgi:hypothetical protein